MAKRICPPWVGYFLSNPLRKLYQNPERILSPYIKEGFLAADIGCAMGFFTLPMAEMAGPKGRVICVDVQEKMIKSLVKRAEKRRLMGRIETRLCAGDSLCLQGLDGSLDFALASAVVHEVPDVTVFFTDLFRALKKSGRLLVIEPRGHVSEDEFEETIAIALEKGFKISMRPEIRGSRSVLLEKF